MEFDHLGWNAVTLAFVGTVCTTLIRAWGAWRQGAKIWRERSGMSVPVPSHLYFLIAQGAIIIYGLDIGSAALLINGTVAIASLLPIVAGLRKFRGFTRRDRLFAIVLLTGVAASAVLPGKDVAFLVWSVGSVVFSTLQPWEIWRNRSRGAVEVRTLLAGLASNAFWLTYAFAIDDWVMKIINPAFTVTIAASLVLWWRFPKPAPAAASRPAG